MAIFARCRICGDHIISYVDVWDEKLKRKVDVWLHDIYDYDPEPDHEAQPRKDSPFI